MQLIFKIKKIVYIELVLIENRNNGFFYKEY